MKQINKNFFILSVFLMLAFLISALSQAQAELSDQIFMPSEAQIQAQQEQIDFADKLSSCTPYKITFQHPFTGEMLEKEILGIVNEKCGYVEKMPGNGKMECQYTESERQVAAQYYKDMALAESFEANLNIDLESAEQQSTYTVNGKVVDNPLQELMNNGVCVISGYGNF